MHVDRSLDAVIPQGRANNWTYGQVGHEMIVHDIEMHHVRAGFQYCVNFVAEPGEVG